MNPDCERYTDVLDYSAFTAQLRVQVEDFLTQLPRLADGSCISKAHRIAEHLLTCGVDPLLTTTLLHAWNESVATPPATKEQIDQVLATAAKRELAAIAVASR